MMDILILNYIRQKQSIFTKEYLDYISDSDINLNLYLARKERIERQLMHIHKRQEKNLKTIMPEITKSYTQKNMHRILKKYRLGDIIINDICTEYELQAKKLKDTNIKYNILFDDRQRAISFLYHNELILKKKPSLLCWILQKFKSKEQKEKENQLLTHIKFVAESS